MKNIKFFPLLLLAGFVSILFSCEDETSTIGSGIAAGEVEIAIDSFYFNLNANPILQENFDSRTGSHMIGNINVPDYGSLKCSFVTRLMCAADLQIPDSLLLPERVDSCKLIMAAQRDDIIGDSLAPQKMTAFLLNRQLPSDINNTFNPEGYYDPSQPLGSLSYTVSNISSSDSMFYKGEFIELDMDLPVEFGREIFEKYRTQPSIFQWPQTFAKEFIPGLYIKPEFGTGCVANIEELLIAVYYHSKELKTVINEGDTVTQLVNVENSVLPFVASPEVLSSNNIIYTPSQTISGLNTMQENGKCVVTTPGGYIASFNFPIQTIIDRYNEKNIHLSTVNDLVLYLPAKPLEAESGIPLVENLLLIKTSDYEEFFAKNKIPDNLSSFTGVYDEVNQRYIFSSMRDYFLDILSNGEVKPEDTQFTLIPVEITTDTQTNVYYGTTTTYVTKCVPYTIKPTVTVLDTGNAMVEFSFSTQMID